MNKQRISVCIVTFEPDLATLFTTLSSLQAELAHLQTFDHSVLIVDNSPKSKLGPWLRERFTGLSVHLLAGHGNIGFGRANNMALTMVGDVHLVLNPDVELVPGAIAEGIKFLMENPECGLVSPFSTSPGGERQYLCKRFPSVLDLVLRGFAPVWLRRTFSNRLAAYEMRDMDVEHVYWNPPIVSGCFMLIRGGLFQKLRGFDPKFFLYFEDFDFSLRAGRVTGIAFVPAVRIVHGGGNAARKGAWHIRMFFRSACTFYGTWGWKLF